MAETGRKGTTVKASRQAGPGRPRKPRPDAVAQVEARTVEPGEEKRRGPYFGPLDTVARLRRELVKLYKAARRQEVDVGDASKLANILYMAARLVAGLEIEKRVEALEKGRPAVEEPDTEEPEEEFNDSEDS